MIKVSKADVLTKDDRWNVVSEIIISLNYPSGDALLNNTWRMIIYNNELSSGGDMKAISIGQSHLFHK